MTPPTCDEPPSPSRADASSSGHPDLQRFGIWLVAITAAFSWPLFQLAAFALESSLYSHILLIPFVSAGLTWSARGHFVPGMRGARSGWAVVPLAAALGLAAWLLAVSGWTWAAVDRLSLAAAVFCLLVWAAALWSASWVSLRVVAFPLAFLVFIVPLPVAATSALESWLQHGSAAAADLFFQISGTPYYFNDLTFELPGIALKVAPECSGIHSTLVLFITSVLAAHLFLRSSVKQTLLIAAVFPLALLRNGFRIFVIGLLCVKAGPEMIHSWVHRHGGPLFFALSLIPLGLLLIVLARSERGPAPRPKPASPTETK